MARINLFLFGFPKIERDGTVVEVDTRKATALLAYLAVTGQETSRDALAGLLWPDYDQSGARAALRRTLSVLNKAVGEGVLLIERERLSVVPGGACWLDVTEFEQGLAGGLEDLERAVTWARDRFMAGFSLRDSSEFDDWQFYQAERLSRELAGGLERLASGYAGHGKFEPAIANAQRWLALDPLREEAHRLLMELYARSGDRSAALRQYRECVRVLDQELGVAPLPETTALYQEVLENRVRVETDLFLNSQEEAGTGQAVGEVAALPWNQPPREPAGFAYPLVGREVERNMLVDTYSRAGAGHFALLEGEAGIGKTRLAEEFLSWAESQGARVGRLRCYEGETGLAYEPFISGLNALLSRPDGLEGLRRVPALALAEAAQLLPEISGHISGLPEPPPIDGPGAQGRFFESLRQVLAGVFTGAKPGVLLIDDIQWADSASLELLAYLSRRLAQTGLFVLATLRSDSQSTWQQLENILHTASRAGLLTRVPLQRLNAADIASLAGFSAQMAPEGFGERLYQETEGLPFFAVEYLETLRRSTNPEAGWALPSGVRDLLQHRLASVDETARQLLSTAAVIGRSFDFNTLREASGRSELETVSGLEGLLAGGLVVERREGEPGEERYDFTHEKLRDLAYEETSLARRRLLHRRIAEELAGPPELRRDRGPLAGMIAYHYSAAGDQPNAAAFYTLAGNHARSLYANIEAIGHYEAALAAGTSEPDVLHEAIGDLRTLQGEYHQAIINYETAASLCRPGCLTGLERKLGSVHARLGDWELAESHYRRAQESATAECGQSELAGVYADWSQAASQLGKPDQARRLGLQALHLAESGSDSLALAQAQNVLGILDRREGDYTGALEHLGQSLRAAETVESPGPRIAALNNLALLHFDLDRLDRAIELAQKALVLCAQVGDRHREAALLNNLADLYHAADKPAEAMDYLKKAVVIFAEIGVEAGGKPEVWKLMEW